MLMTTQNLFSQKIVHTRNKIHFISLGCSRNLVDSEVMLGILLKAGYEATDQLANADYLILNTCAFLKAARDEGKAYLQRLIQEKKKGAKIISNLASLVVLIILWQSSEDLKLLIPIMVSVAVAVLDSIYLFFGFIIYSIRNR